MPDGDRYIFTLRVMLPSEIDADTHDEILAARDSQDDDDAAVLRWLGGFVDETEDFLGSILPVGFYVKIENGRKGAS